MPLNTPVVKKFFLVSSLWLLVPLLSGCSTIGTNKPAALQVSSVPEASVFLDGKHLGKTPFYSDQLKEGPHSLKITASEATFLTDVNLRESTLTVVNRQLATNFLAQSGEILALEPGKNGFLVTSQPEEANLIIDGKLAGQTPILVEGIIEGEHRIEISKNDYSTRQFAIKIAKNYQLQAEVTLAAEIAKGTVPAATPIPVITKVEITQTPQGFLRVRKDPSLNSPEIGRVNTKEQFEVIQETSGWVKISFQGKQGWVSSQYTKKI